MRYLTTGLILTDRRREADLDTPYEA
jgi:hypothetical protein